MEPKLLCHTLFHTQKNFTWWYKMSVLNLAVVGQDAGFTLAQLSHARPELKFHLNGVGLGVYAAYFAADWYWY